MTTSNAMIWTKQAETIHFGKDVPAMAREQAKKGSEWLLWRNNRGTFFAAQLTANTLKKAMLDCGTQGTFTLYSRNAYAEMVNWCIAALWFKKLKAGTWV